MSWIIRILVLSLIVGLVISFFNINPMGILNDTWDTILAVGGLFSGMLDWALPYILVGAVVVVPIALIGGAAALPAPASLKVAGISSRIARFRASFQR